MENGDAKERERETKGGTESAGSRWTEGGRDHDDYEGGNARNGAERGIREEREGSMFCLPRAMVARFSFSFFSARTRGDFSTFPAPSPSHVPTFRRGFSGISFRDRKQEGRRSVKSNSTNVQPRRRFTFLAENSFASWKN